MSFKGSEGRSESILDPDIPIIDTHHHLFVRPDIRYLLDDFLSDAGAGHNVVASVYLEARSMYRPDGPEPLRPLGEVEFANGIAAMSASGLFGPCRVGAAIVAHADLQAGDGVAAYLDEARQLAPARLRGVRQVTMTHPSKAIEPLLRYRCAPGILASDRFRAGFRHLAPRGLSFDAAVFHSQLDEVADLARDFPDTTVVLNHLGLAVGYGVADDARAELFREWREQLRKVSRQPNVVCKVGGLGMRYWGFGFEARPGPVPYQELAQAWMPYVQEALDAFGADRCMAESNFPVDGHSCGYVPLWNALKHTVRDLALDEKAALFHRTATRVYRIA